jgi:hypothetical protein
MKTLALLSLLFIAFIALSSCRSRSDQSVPTKEKAVVIDFKPSLYKTGSTMYKVRIIKYGVTGFVEFDNNYYLGLGDTILYTF